MRNACKMLVWKPKSKRLFRKLRRREEDGIKIDPKKNVDLNTWVGFV
jgi:hypothetical protein